MIDFDNKPFFKLKESKEYGTKVQDLLLEGEEIASSFKAMRDGVVFTNKRIIVVNVQGITGSKIDYTSIPYSKIVTYSVETAGTFDLDAELTIWISGVGVIRFDFKGGVNIRQLSNFISMHIL